MFMCMIESACVFECIVYDCWCLLNKRITLAVWLCICFCCCLWALTFPCLVVFVLFCFADELGPTSWGQTHRSPTGRLKDAYMFPLAIQQESFQSTIRVLLGSYRNLAWALHACIRHTIGCILESCMIPVGVLQEPQSNPTGSVQTS